MKSLQPARSRRLGPALLGLAVFGFLFSAAAAHSAAELDWSMVTWENGLMMKSYTLSNGVTVEIRVHTMAEGQFRILEASGATTTTPYIDCPPDPDPPPPPAPPPLNPHHFGTSCDLAVGFDPDPDQNASPVIIEVEFSEPVTDLTFEISDIDFSGNSSLANFRRDQVVITSDNGNPDLAYKVVESGCNATPECSATPDCTATFLIDELASSATAILDRTAMPCSNIGTLVVRFPNAVELVTITYNEASMQPDPPARGIGILAMFSETPVELMSFSVD